MCSCAGCAAGVDETRSHFAQLALIEVRYDAAWGRKVARLAEMLPGETETPL